MSKRLYEFRPVTEAKGLKDGMAAFVCLISGCVLLQSSKEGRGQIE
jgi:hypothetical protein